VKHFTPIQEKEWPKQPAGLRTESNAPPNDSTHLHWRSQCSTNLAMH